VWLGTGRDIEQATYTSQIDTNRGRADSKTDMKIEWELLLNFSIFASFAAGLLVRQKAFITWRWWHWQAVCVAAKNVSLYHFKPFSKKNKSGERSARITQWVQMQTRESGTEGEKERQRGRVKHSKCISPPPLILMPVFWAHKYLMKWAETEAI